MTNRTLSAHLKRLLIGIGICGVVSYGLLFPAVLRAFFPEQGTRVLAWMIFLAIALIPCYAVLVFGWKIAVNIGKERSFCSDNAAYLGHIARLSLLDTAFVFLVQIAFVLLNFTHPTLILIALLVLFIGISVTISAILLAHLVEKATMLQAESDATI